MSEKEKKTKGKGKKGKKGNKENVQENVEESTVVPDARLMRKFEEGAAGDFAKLLHHDWTLDEDKLLVQSQFFDPVVPLKLLVKKYLARQKKDPRRFNKVANIEMFRNRLAEIQQNTEWLNLIKKAIKLELDIEAASKKDEVVPDEEAPEEDETPAAIPQVQFVVSKNYQNSQTIVANKTPMINASSMLKGMFEASSIGLGKGELPSVTLDPVMSNYSAALEFSVIEPHVVEMLCSFVESPDMVLRQGDLSDRLEKTRSDMAVTAESVQEQIHTNRKKLLANATALCKSEERSMKESLEKEFEIEIKEIRQRHLRRVQECTAAVRAKWDNLVGQAETFFAVQQDEMVDVCTQVLNSETTRMGKELDECKKKSDAIFSGDMPMKLAILAEMLQVDKLQESTRQLFVNDIWAYAPFPDWQCQSIRENVAKAVLVQLPIEEVLKLRETQPPDNYIDPVMVVRELNYRKLVLREHVKGLDNDDLRKVVDSGDCPFPEVIEEAVAQRQDTKAFGRVAIDEDLLSPHAEIDSTMLSCKTTSSHRYVTIQATAPVKSGSWGRWYYEVAIDCLDEVAGSSISVGWDPPRNALDDGPLPGLVPNSSGDFGVAMQHDGLVHKGGHGDFIGTRFKEGDVIGVGIDLMSNCVSFYVNGTRVIAQGTGGTAGYSEGKTGDFKTHATNYTLLPAVCMYSVRESKLCSVTMNFMGPFVRKNMTGWMPLGRPK